MRAFGVRKPVVLAFAAALAWASWLRAGWADHAPVAINPTAGETNPHYNSGGRRIVRIGGTTIAICPDGTTESAFRSTDNGRTWTKLYTRSGFSGCLITGPNEYVYHFVRYGGTLYMVKFRYNATPPSPVAILANVEETDVGAYAAVNAIVDREGVLYVAIHWGSPDTLYVIVSSDAGSTWSAPRVISGGADPRFYPHLEATSENLLVCVYQTWTEGRVFFAKSADKGLHWTTVSLGAGAANPAILTSGASDLLVFCQNDDGLVFKRSSTRGDTWSSNWILVDPTCGYADPSPALGSDGKTIYVAYRSSNGTGVTSGTCGDQCRSRLAMSRDLGQSWTFPDSYYDAERTGTRNQIRYQTWWNYGGPVEWIWMQYTSGETRQPIFYDVNTDATILAHPGTIIADPAIVTTGLPDAIAGEPYSQTVQATGGIVPYTWAITSGALPQGLSLGRTTGAISGTPAAAGIAVFIVQVTDSRQTTAATELSIEVLPTAQLTAVMAGDSNHDGKVDLADAVFTLRYLFSGGPHPSCLKEADANDSDVVDISDVVTVLYYLFRDGALVAPDGTTVDSSVTPACTVYEAGIVPPKIDTAPSCETECAP